jgi:hypothetical protein
VNDLDESRLVTWVVHTARRFVERAKREARRRPLAAITQKSVGGSSSNITDAEKNTRDSGGGGGFSPRVSMARLGAAYTRLEADDECDEANLVAVLLHPWKGSSGGKTGGGAGRASPMGKLGLEPWSRKKSTRHGGFQPLLLEVQEEGGTGALGFILRAGEGATWVPRLLAE